jgi:hypothetical protein
MHRVFGFEIMPAPFVITHWQVGLRLADAGAPIGAGTETATVYLTNALTGWEPPLLAASESGSRWLWVPSDLSITSISRVMWERAMELG